MSEDLWRGELVRLAAIEPEDAEAILPWHQDAAFLRGYGAEPALPRGIEDVRELLAGLGRNDRLFAVRRLEDDALVGVVGLDGINWVHGVAGASVGIGPAFQGRGYGREALALLLRLAYDELNLFRLTVTVFAYNRRAIALYEGLGFQHEGAMRAFVRRDGRRYDLLIMGLLEPEWRRGAAAQPPA
jgi:RimJ/RimL family protein N-acetyltransferase